MKVDASQEDGSWLLTWTFHEKAIRKRYPGPVTAVPLQSGLGVLVVEPPAAGPDNAIILRPDGSLLTRIVNPLGERGAVCFTDAGYEGTELTLITRLPGLEVACVVDDGGELIRTLEVR